MMALLGLLAGLLLPFVFAFEFFLIGDRTVQPAKRNLSRATRGAFLFVFVVVGFGGLQTFGPLATQCAAGAGIVAVLLIAVGVNGARNAGPHDPIETLLWATAALVFGGVGFTGYLPHVLDLHGPARAIANALSCGGAAASLLRFMLLLRPAPSATLPHPSTVPGLPMAGPASSTSAHAALGRRGRAARPKFRV